MAGTCCNLSQIMSDPLFAMEVSAVETLFEAGDVLENTVELLPSTVLGNVSKCPNACPHRRSLQFFVKSTVRPSEFRILHFHQRLGYDAVWPFNSWGGDMRELLTSGSSDTVQAVYEAIEPQTPLAKTIKQHGFVRFITSMKNQMSQHWSHEDALRWAVFVEMASIRENM